MELSFLGTLHCPFCGSGLDVVFRSSGEGGGGDVDSIRYGVLRCACSRYPVVGGIPILQHIDGLQSVVDLITARDERRALLQCMNVFRIKWAHRTRWHQARYYFNCRRLVADRDLCFRDAVDLVRRPRVFADYLFHRYANPSFLAGAGVLQLLGSLQKDSVGTLMEGSVATGTPDEPRGPNWRGKVTSDSVIRVIDLACGAGHSSFLMQRLYPEMSVVAVDSDFISLYLAKQFIAPEATHVCLDAECPSPFPDRYFNAVFCLDAFHYLHSKRAVLGELQRILTSSAIWLFPHLHNALQHNMVAGIPLSPERYLECFGFLEARLFDEGDILHGLCDKRVLDLEASSALSRLNDAPTLTLIGGQRKLWGVHREFPSGFYSDRPSLEINPIYRVKRSGDKLDLSLKWPNPVMKEECSAAESILPRQYQLDKNELLELLEEKREPNDERLSDLVSRFILIPLPANYMADRWRA